MNTTNTNTPNVSDASSIDFNTLSAKELFILCAESLDNAINYRMVLENNRFYPNWLPFINNTFSYENKFNDAFDTYADSAWYDLSPQEQVLGYLFLAEIYS